jgi:hypothetical protein
MAGGAQSMLVHAFDDDYRKAKTWNLNAADQAAGRGSWQDSRRSGGNADLWCSFLSGHATVVQGAGSPL